MARLDYTITVVDALPAWKWRNARARDLAQLVPLWAARRWQRVRREMSPAGLARKARANRS